MLQWMIENEIKKIRRKYDKLKRLAQDMQRQVEGRELEELSLRCTMKISYDLPRTSVIHVVHTLSLFY